MITIALDAMSGDNGLKTTASGAMLALKKHPDLHIIMVGLISEIKKEISAMPDRMSFHNATEIVLMDDSPSLAMRNKKDSSMRVALNLVNEGVADAIVSAGNTGALMATARFVLKMHKGIDRPVLCTSLPTKKNPVWLLDLGANIESTPKQLLQFALMGNALLQALLNRTPSVGLLNIGEEEMKGNETIKQASILLKNTNLDYRGFIEGNDIFESKVDLVVCDGFIGNITLKSIEGVAHLIQHSLHQAFTLNWYRKIVAIIALPILKSLKKTLNPKEYNGASLLGLKHGLVIKSHGNTDSQGMLSAITVAYQEASGDLLNKIKLELEKTNVE